MKHSLRALCVATALLSAAFCSNSGGHKSPPAIASITPQTGSTGGGTTVIISGTNLTQINSVTFGGYPASSFHILSSSQISAVTPSESAGEVAVAIRGSAGSSMLSAGFTFAAQLTLSPSTMSNCYTGVTCSTALNVSGGVSPYTITVSSGALPTGLSMQGGSVTGTPTTAGTFNFVLKASDTSTPSKSVTQNYSVTVVNPLLLPSVAFNTGITGQSFNGAIATSGGTGVAANYTFSVIGSLPAGLTFSQSGANGTISGTPTTPGTSNFSIKVVDSGNPNQTVTQNFSISVVAPLAITAGSLPNGIMDNAYSATVTTSGGSPTKTFSLISGSTPSGTAFSNATVSGTLMQAGTYTFTVQAMDNSTPAQSVSKMYTVEVNNPTVGSLPFSIHTLRLPTAAASVSYNAPINVLGGSPPYTAVLAPASEIGEANGSQLPDNSELFGGGTLPPGINLYASGASVTLSGTPTTNGVYQFVVKITDTASEVAYQVLAINVGGVTPPAPPDPPQFASLLECQRTSLSPQVLSANPANGCAALPSPNVSIPPVYDGTAGTIYTDPDFGTRIKRLTPPASSPGVYAPIYNPIEAWSATGKFLIVSGPGGFLYLFSGKDPYTFIRPLTDVPEDGVDQATALWDNSNDCIYYDTFKQSIRAINVCNNDNIIVIGNFPTLTDTQGNVLNLAGNTANGSPLNNNFNPSGAVNPLVIKPYTYCSISDDNKMLAAKITDGQGIVYGFATFDLTQLNANYFMHKVTAPGDLVNRDIHGNVVTPANKEPAQACISPDGDYVSVAWNTPIDAADNGPYTHGGNEQFDSRTGAPIPRTGAFIPGIGFPCVLAPCADTNYISSDFDTHQDQIRLADGSEGIFSAFCGSDNPGPSTSFVEYTVYPYNPLLTLGCNGSTGVAHNYLPDASDSFGAWHTSGRNTIGPNAVTRGWGLVSSFGYPTGVDGINGGPQIPMGTELFALKMDGSNTVRRIAHDQTCRQSDYFAEPHASPSRDFHHAIFGSNWRDCSGAVSDQVYIVEIP